jgi:2'-5' RNA ligase
MKQKTVRLFFALWPNAPVRDQLLEASSEIRFKHAGRRIPKANLHLTLHFIGNTYVENAYCLQDIASQVVIEPFSIQLDRAGQFKRAGIVWLGCSAPPTELFELHHQLGRLLCHCDYQLEKRPYRPHVTLSKKASLFEEKTLTTPVNWSVRGFSLISSQQDRQSVFYQEIQCYPK